jgi:Flp pilus assembly protein TadD
VSGCTTTETLVVEREGAETVVEWELAGGWDEEAWERFASADYEAARSLVAGAIRRLRNAEPVDADVLAALYYDQGVCYDLLGRFTAADRSFDEALTLSGTELHIETLRAFRRRVRAAGGRSR